MSFQTTPLYRVIKMILNIKYSPCRQIWDLSLKADCREPGFTFSQGYELEENKSHRGIKNIQWKHCRFNQKYVYYINASIIIPESRLYSYTTLLASWTMTFNSEKIINFKKDFYFLESHTTTLRQGVVGKREGEIVQPSRLCSFQKHNGLLAKDKSKKSIK